MTHTTPAWDRFAAELADTRQAEMLRQTCSYCGRRRCREHSDLPKLDPHFNVQAARFARRTQTGPAGTTPQEKRQRAQTGRTVTR